jgi:voltage-dependent anion channel protein 2
MPAFGDIGKSAKEILTGGRDGVFQFDQKVTMATRTADGVALTFTAKKTDKTDLAVKTAYNTKHYALDAVFNTSDKVAVNSSLMNLAPGLKVSTSITLPDLSSGKATVDYAFPYLNLKSTVGLNSAPAIDVSAATAYKNMLLGGEAGYDTAKSALTKWNVAVGYHAADSQLAAFVNNGNNVKLLLAHKVSSTRSIGAEIAKNVSGSTTSFAVATEQRLASGGLLKFKIDNAGIASGLYEQKLTTGEKYSLSGQIDTLNLSKPPKMGFAVDLA